MNSDVRDGATRVGARDGTAALVPASEEGRSALPVAMKESDYPALFISTDAAAKVAQTIQTRLVRLEIMLTLLAGLIGALKSVLPNQVAGIGIGGITTITAVLLFAAALLISSTRATQRYDKRWADSRAAAETVKTLTWQYMMRVAPYDGSVAEANRQFLSDAKEAMHGGKYVERRTTALPEGAQVVTPSMLDLRAQALRTRRDVYVRDRVREQYRWYCRKAAINERSSQLWFFAGMLAKTVALVGTALASTTSHSSAFIAAAAALATAVIAMAQTGRYDELAHSYGAAGENLQLLEPLFGDETVNDEDSLSTYVGKAEGILSKEYADWQAKQA